MEAKDFLEEIDYYNTNVEGQLYEELGIETLADILEVYHQRKLKLLGISGVVGRSEQLPLNKTFFNKARSLSYTEFSKWINTILR